LPTDDHLAARQTLAELDRLLADAPAVGGALPPGFRERVGAYLRLLLAANRRLNLTRVTGPAEVARLHLLDSLAALPMIDDATPAAAIDLGSGGGLPGIPLAIARPGIHWTLVDSVGRKATALRGFVEALGLSNVSVFAERAETLGRDPDHRERYGLVTARACAALPVLVELAMPLLAEGGSLIAWKGPLTDRDAEMQRGRNAADQVGGGPPRIQGTGLDALGGHTLVSVAKERPTPSRFPRRPGEPARRPLG